MTQKSCLKISSFYVFNYTLAKGEEDEEKKILYYYPPDTKLDAKLNSVGLCEALIKFTASFNAEQPCELLCTKKAKQLLLQPEKDFWMVINVSVENSEDSSDEDVSQRIQENVFKSILEMAYRNYFLQNGSFQSALVDEDSSGLTTRLDNFFNEYLECLGVDHCNILDAFNGIEYLPLGREEFLHVQSFINSVEAEFNLSQSMFLFNDHLIWSGVDPRDTQVLYQYLVKTLLPSQHESSLQDESPQNGYFVTTSSGSRMNSLPQALKVYLRGSENIECFNLVVFRMLGAVMGLFAPYSKSIAPNIFDELESFMRPKLTNLVAEINEYCTRSAASCPTEPLARFIYFNKLNLALKSSALEQKKGGSPALTSDKMQLLANLNADQTLCCDNREIILGYPNETWVILKCSNQREFYVVTQKKSSIKDAVAETKRVCANQLKGIFFMT